MKKFRKILAEALVAALFTTMFAISPQAAEPDGAQAGVSAEDYEISAYNSMGNLIADEIADYQAAGEGTDNAARSYLISDIEISGSTATVSYIAQENCVVLVALYDESTGKLLATGKSYVTKNEHSIDIEIAAEQMPQYFILKGFMLDSGNAPLSDEYYSEIYTAELQ